MRCVRTEHRFAFVSGFSFSTAAETCKFSLHVASYVAPRFRLGGGVPPSVCTKKNGFPFFIPFFVPFSSYLMYRPCTRFASPVSPTQHASVVGDDNGRYHIVGIKTYSDGYTMAVDACIWSNNPDRALTYVRGMRQRSSFRPTVVHYEKAVRAMAAGGRYRDAYQLLAEAVEVCYCTFSVSSVSTLQVQLLSACLIWS